MDMIKHRRLLTDKTCDTVCLSVKNRTFSVDNCLEYISSCVDSCPEACDFSPSPPPPTTSTLLHRHHAISQPLVISIVFLAATLCTLLFYSVYFKFYKRRRIPTLGLVQQHQEINNTIVDNNNDDHDDDDDDDDRNHPVVDHHVWYIRTVGLNPSVINAIAVLKYNKDDGIVEGTDCSVCLSEFEKDETVRLLPKCNHAFHISCIDTWLRSHTNCPNCRAPIVVNSEGGTGNGNNSSDMVRLDVISDNEEPTVIREEEENELDGDDKEEEEDIIQPMRRSVSLDSLSALKIHQGVADLNSELESSLSNVNSVAKTNGNQILPLPRSIASSSSARFFNFQSGQTSLKRSITWNGKFLSSRHNHSRSQSSIGQP